jgi:outer membrane protein assembly factor BamE (lipoprotein component of BamABCDE complex)
MKKLILYIMSALLICGCASQSRTSGSPRLSREFVDRNLIKGKTTKADVQALLGEPQSTASSDIAGFRVESWSYTKTFYRDASEKGFGYAVAYNLVNPASNGYDRVEVSILTITFDSSGIVTGHTFATAASGMPR